METEKTLYSAIPMRTWRWLGVNEAYVPSDVVWNEKMSRPRRTANCPSQKARSGRKPSYTGRNRREG